MIVILSTASDNSTDIVEDWLEYYGADRIRLNFDEAYNDRDNAFRRVTDLLSDSRPFNLWIRTNNISFNRNTTDDCAKIAGGVFLELNFSLVLLLCRKAQKVLGCSMDNIVRFSKLNTLEAAAEIGLKYPETAFIDNKAGLQSFIATHREAITKPFHEVLKIEKDGTVYKTLTTHLSPARIGTLPEYFGVSMVQRRIDKAFDLKITYLDKELFPALIVSRNRDHREADYRDYHSSNIQMTRYGAIAAGISESIRLLMDKLELNFGVLDFVIDKKGELFFLEVNPYGLFRDASHFCHFHIERKIAQWLINNSSQYSN